MKIEPPITG